MIDPDDPVPGGLRLGGHNGDLFIQDAVKERGLARVGRTHDGHKS